MLEKFLTEAGVGLLIAALGFLMLLIGRLLHIWGKSLSARVSMLEAGFQTMKLEIEGLKSSQQALVDRVERIIELHITVEAQHHSDTLQMLKELRQGQQDVVLNLLGKKLESS